MYKNKIKKVLRKNPSLLRYLQYIYNMFFHKDRLMQKCSFGNMYDTDQILIIRPTTDDGIQGLMSLFIQAMRWVDYANRKGVIPYIDFKNYKTQYYDGIGNVWDYFFTQPSSLSIDEVYNSKRVIVSGATWYKTVDETLFRGEVFNDSKLSEKCFSVIWNNIDYSDEVKNIVEKENKVIQAEKCIGVYLRGTDYIQLKPTGEYVQPDIESVIQKVDEFIHRYGNLKIFLVTEDYKYYHSMKQKYKDEIKIVSYDKFIQNYDGKNFLSKSNVLEENPKKRGMDYLVKIVLLSKCKYLVSSITMGSIAAYSLNGGVYEDSYIFNLGFYK